MYERPKRLDLQYFATNQKDQRTGYPAPLADVPAYLLSGVLPTAPKHRHRRWGKRAGRLVKLKACFTFFSAAAPVDYGLLHPIPKRLLDPIASCSGCRLGRT